MENLVEVEGLSTHFRTFDGLVRATDGVSFSIKPGECLALVGESGCGKSVTARSLMGLYSGSRVEQSGSIRYRGEELQAAAPARRAALRGRDLAMIFQEPMAAFDPLATVGAQMVEARLVHFPPASRSPAALKAARAEARLLAVAALKEVGIPDPGVRIDEYPHRLSGGMLQRVLIAIALMNKPALLIADEPTTALDVTIQAQVLRLVRDLRAETGMAVLFITHDLGVVAEIADRVHVMYAGRVVERATVAELFSRGPGKGPAHPYARGLLESRVERSRKGSELPSIPGSVPRPSEFPAGCRFAPRCEKAGPRCLREEPILRPEAAAGPGLEARGLDRAACWLHEGGVA
ncbi:MAG: ABC transporter ATP-binding protein [Spirochaetaceae bacterium]|nr:ABC transporter ATP-binding protein [Spirochaetaceae bacterium]